MGYTLAMKFSFFWPVNFFEHYIAIDLSRDLMCRTFLAPSGVLCVPASQEILTVAVFLPPTETRATSISPHCTGWKKVSSCLLPTHIVSLDSLGITYFCLSNFIFVELIFNNVILKKILLMCLSCLMELKCKTMKWLICTLFSCMFLSTAFWPLYLDYIYWPLHRKIHFTTSTSCSKFCSLNWALVLLISKES